MRREEKYPDTRTFHFYNANPKNRITGDCTFRAISTALNQTWEETVMDMARFSCECGFAINDKKGIERYLKSKGWVMQKQPKREDGTKYTGSEFCKMMKSKGNTETMIAMIGKCHIVAIVNNKVYDHWNSTKGKIGNYWIKED